MKQFFFVRHGQTEWNAIRRMQGQWNSDLSDLGKRQANENGALLNTLGIEAMVASPLDRTRQTADIIDQHLNIGYSTDDRLKEWHCGDWSGELWADLPNKWPEEFASWQADQFNYRPPAAENYPDMIQRATLFLSEFVMNGFNKTAIVSHGVIGRAMIGTLLSLSPEEMLAFAQPNDTIISVSGTEGAYRAQHFIEGKGFVDGLPARQG